MKFEEKYPHCPAGKTPIETIGLTVQEMRDLPNKEDRFWAGMYLKIEDFAPCWICGEQTSWLDMSFETFCCSTECADKAWQDYEEACRESDRKYGGLKREGF